jgi:hypothetical protein
MNAIPIAAGKGESFKAGLADGPNYVCIRRRTADVCKLQSRQAKRTIFGWYMHGGIIYDMVINDNGYAGDYIDQDGQGYDAGVEDTEREGNRQ